MKIENITIENPYFLAPLAGYTDMSFRRLCGKYCELSTTEMISINGLFYGDKKTHQLMKRGPEEKNLAIQLFGNEAKIYKSVIEKNINDMDTFDMIDINMGCPAPKVVKNGYGSALIQRPDLAYEIMKTCVETSNKPVSIKTRKSFGGKESLELIELAQKAGVAMITIHGRTREEYYSNKSDWAYIKKVKDSVDIPVIGNGDITSYEIALEKMKESGVDGIAIGTGAIGNPFIFEELYKKTKGIKYKKPTPEEKIQMAILHLHYICEDKGEKLGVLEMRKQFVGYFKGMIGSKELRNKINTINRKDEVIKVLEAYGLQMGFKA